jgi:hypothetical protein
MAPKPKAGGAKKRPAKATPKEKPQRERFIEAARVAGVDETGKQFERALKLIVPPKTMRH